MPNILITTFGATWQIVPELLGFTNPELVELYACHPELESIKGTRENFAIRPVDELWLVSTKGSFTDQAIKRLLDWHDLLKGSTCPVFRLWQVVDTKDLSSETECQRMAECIFRLVLHASEHVQGDQLVISLAGGRKTMSSDIQNAAVSFGCHALIHVIQNEKYAAHLREYGPGDFTVPLPDKVKDAVTPLVVGRYDRNPVLYLDMTSDASISGIRFPIPFPGGPDPADIWTEPPLLTTEIQGRQEKAGFLYCNYTNRLMSEETGANFLALYNLPPDIIQELKRHMFGVSPEKRDRELAWIRRLPKTELHCHLGGIANISELIEIAAANSEAVDRHMAKIDIWLEGCKRKLEEKSVGGFDFKQLRKAVPGVPEPVCVSAFVLLFEDDPDTLDEIVFGPFRDEGAFLGIGFEDYEALGDLQGSGLLQSEESLRAACRILTRKADQHNIKYLELRCSPVNYSNGGLNPVQVARIIDHELANSADLTCSLIFIASRHGKMSKVNEHIELAQELMGPDGSNFPSFSGFDLAGNEKAGNPVQMREAFMPMMEKCMHFTIHAGEIQDVGSIWEAVYHLNAERIGHGLTLKDNPNLLEKFRDRNIAIEMCPSSNFQIVGFWDNYLRTTDNLTRYPLKEYLDKGLRVTVNTDNPGISRTDFTKEIHRAGRLTPGGLSIWDILILIRNGFKAAFSRRTLRQKMLREAETEILALIQEGLPS